jgi:hypothetical protein
MTSPERCQGRAGRPPGSRLDEDGHQGRPFGAGSRRSIIVSLFRRDGARLKSVWRILSSGSQFRKVKIMLSRIPMPLPLVGFVMLTCLGAPLSAEDNMNSTIQVGKVNINQTRQCGDINDNATYQDGKVNINRTVQGGCGGRGSAMGEAGKMNANKPRPDRSQASLAAKAR